MTKKHFEQIAATLKAQLEAAKLIGMAYIVEAVIRGLATDFRSFNPNFDSARFLRAAGVVSKEGN